MDFNRKGIQNIGNTCFMNAILQCLKYSQFGQQLFNFRARFKGKLANLFIQLIEEFDNNSNTKNKQYKIFLTNENIFNINNYSNRIVVVNENQIQPLNFNNNQQKKFIPGEMKSLIESKIQKYKGDYMHDSIEFFVNFLSLLNEESNEMKNLIDSLFSIEIQTEIIINTDKSYYQNIKDSFSNLFYPNDHRDNHKIEREKFYHLELPLIDHKSEKLECIKDCLKEYLKSFNFKGNIFGKEKVNIVSISPILVISLQRVYKGYHINHFVEYPLELNLSEFIYQNNYNYNSFKKQYIYRLVGLVIHEGNEMAGHKISICYDNKYRQWLAFDDDKVSSLSDPLDLKNAFILFYQQLKNN